MVPVVKKFSRVSKESKFDMSTSPNCSSCEHVCSMFSYVTAHIGKNIPDLPQVSKHLRFGIIFLKLLFRAVLHDLMSLFVVYTGFEFPLGLVLY